MNRFRVAPGQLRPIPALQWAPNDGAELPLPLEVAGISAIFAATLGALTSASAAQAGIAGATAKTLGALTLAATGQVGVVGTTAATLAPVTSGGAGQVGDAGIAASALASIQIASTGAVGVAGALSGVLAGVVATAAATVAGGARGASTLAPLALVSTATVADATAPVVDQPATPAGGSIYPRRYRDVPVSARRLLQPQPVNARLHATLDGVRLVATCSIRESFRNRRARAALLLAA